jgi:hypothetical protein
LIPLPPSGLARCSRFVTFLAMLVMGKTEARAQWHTRARSGRRRWALLFERTILCLGDALFGHALGGLPLLPQAISELARVRPRRHGSRLRDGRSRPQPWSLAGRGFFLPIRLRLRLFEFLRNLR